MSLKLQQHFPENIISVLSPLSSLINCKFHFHYTYVFFLSCFPPIQVVNSTYNTAPLQKLLLTMGMCPRGAEPSLPGAGSEYYIVMLDGMVLGWLHDRVAKNVADQLRVMKVKGLNDVSVVELSSWSLICSWHNHMVLLSVRIEHHLLMWLNAVGSRYCMLNSFRPSDAYMHQ